MHIGRVRTEEEHSAGVDTKLVTASIIVQLYKSIKQKIFKTNQQHLHITLIS